MARQFAEPFGAGELAAAAGLLHDAGKAECVWQKKLLVAEETRGAVGCDHKKLGSRLLVPSARKTAMVILGHHGGLTDAEQLREVRDEPLPDEAETVARLFKQVPEAQDVIGGPVLVPETWRRDALLLEMGVRLTFSALVDGDHLDTGAHFQGLDSPTLTPAADMVHSDPQPDGDLGVRQTAAGQQHNPRAHHVPLRDGSNDYQDSILPPAPSPAAPKTRSTAPATCT